MVVGWSANNIYVGRHLATYKGVDSRVWADPASLTIGPPFFRSLTIARIFRNTAKISLAFKVKRWQVPPRQSRTTLVMCHVHARLLSIRLLLQIISQTILCHSPFTWCVTPYCFWREHSGVKIKSVSVCVSVPIEFLRMSVSGQNETLLLKLYPAKMNTNPQNLSRQNCPHVLNSPTISGCKTPTITFLWPKQNAHNHFFVANIVHMCCWG